MRTQLKRLLRAVKAKIKGGNPAGVQTPQAPQEPPPAPMPKTDEELLNERYNRRERFIIADLVSAVLPPDERFTILDGGAREALADPRWQALDASRVRIYGFEPDDAAVAQLNKEAADRGLDYRYFAAGLWSKPAKLTFYENKSPGGGSFYKQKTELTDRWKFANTEQKFLSREIFFPTGTSEWQLTSISEWASEQKISDIDFMKLNVQGAELEILAGSGGLLDAVTGLMVEVSFVESYRDRPFFSDIDSFLRKHGFTFFDLIGHHYMGRARSSITARHAPGLYPLWGQLIEGHGIYFRDPIDLERSGREVHATLPKLLKLAAFAEMFGQNEYAFELLDWLLHRQRRLGDNEGVAMVEKVFSGTEKKYRQIMGGWAPLPDQPSERTHD